MLIHDMAKAPPPSASAVKCRRGRPPKPGGRISQVEVQRAYRARLAAAGKVVRIFDARKPALAAIPDAEFAAVRERLRNALLKLELREQDVILAALNFDLCPIARSDGADDLWRVHQGGPGGTACVHDSFVGVPDLVTEGIAAQIRPDVLDRVQLRCVGR
jgi:hypothetical protein